MWQKKCWESENISLNHVIQDKCIWSGKCRNECGMLLQCMRYEWDTELYSLEYESNQHTQLIKCWSLWYEYTNGASYMYTTLVFQMTSTHKI